jgi:hypothetical protein
MLLLLNSIFSSAQDAAKEITKVLEQYKALTTLDIEIHYYYYESHNAKTATEEALGFYQKEGEKLIIKQYGTEMINDGKYVLLKDDSSKVIGLDNAKKEPETTFNIEQTLAHYDRIEALQSNKERQKAYLIGFKKEGQSEYSKAIIYVNATTNLLDEIVLYYKKPFDLSTESRTNNYQKPKLRMVYTKVDTHPIFPKGTFSVSKYVEFNTKGKHTLKKQYSSYEFYDQTK